MAFPSLVNLIKDPKGANPIPERAMIGDLRVDVLRSEEMTVDYVITDAPVEEGLDIGYSRVKRPVILRMVGILTDTQLTPGGISSRFQDGEGFSLQTWQEKQATLLQLADAGELISVVTPLKMYPQMKVQSVRLEQREGETQAVFFLIVFKELRIVSSEVSSVDESQVPKELKDKETKGQKKAKKKKIKKKNGGNKTPKEVSPEKRKSLIFKLLNGLSGG